MNKEFCINCGHKNIFESARPKFCAGCGQALNTSSKASVKSVSNKQHQNGEEREVDINIAALDLDELRTQIGIGSFHTKPTLDDLWKSPAPREDLSRPPSKDPVGQAVLDQIMQECSSSKTPVTIEAKDNE